MRISRSRETLTGTNRRAGVVTSERLADAHAGVEGEDLDGGRFETGQDIGRDAGDGRYADDEDRQGHDDDSVGVFEGVFNHEDGSFRGMRLRSLFDGLDEGLQRKHGSFAHSANDVVADEAGREVVRSNAAANDGLTGFKAALCVREGR